MQLAEWPLGGSKHARCHRKTAQPGLRGGADTGRQVALRGRGFLGAETSRRGGVAWGKHLGRCGRSLSEEETLEAGLEPDPRALLAVPLGDAWLYEARRRGASPDCTHASRDPSDQRGKPGRVGSVRFRGSSYLSSHRAW